MAAFGLPCLEPHKLRISVAIGASGWMELRRFKSLLPCLLGTAASCHALTFNNTCCAVAFTERADSLSTSYAHMCASVCKRLSLTRRVLMMPLFFLNA
jgi:hypothetical protein